jgi:hypothetical protein
MCFTKLMSWLKAPARGAQRSTYRCTCLLFTSMLLPDVLAQLLWIAFDVCRKVAKAYFSLKEALCHNHMLFALLLLPLPPLFLKHCFHALQEGGQGLFQPHQGSVPQIMACSVCCP